MIFKGKAIAVIGAVCAAWLGAVAWDYAQNQSPAGASGARANKGAAAAPKGATASDVVATIDGVPITREELDRDLIVRLNQLEDEMFDARQEHLETLIGDRLLAT